MQIASLSRNSSSKQTFVLSKFISELQVLFAVTSRVPCPRQSLRIFILLAHVPSKSLSAHPLQKYSVYLGPSNLDQVSFWLSSRDCTSKRIDRGLLRPFFHLLSASFPETQWNATDLDCRSLFRFLPKRLLNPVTLLLIPVIIHDLYLSSLISLLFPNSIFIYFSYAFSSDR